MKDVELRLITAVDIIKAVEKSPYYGDGEFLCRALGKKTFKKMLGYGYITIGFYIKQGVHITYSTTDRYAIMRDSIRRERFLNTLPLLRWMKISN